MTRQSLLVLFVISSVARCVCVCISVCVYLRVCACEIWRAHEGLCVCVCVCVRVCVYMYVHDCAYLCDIVILYFSFIRFAGVCFPSESVSSFFSWGPRAIERGLGQRRPSLDGV